MDYISCGECRYFGFFEGSETIGKCNRDSVYDFAIVNATDIKCRTCASCEHPYQENDIWRCFWRNQIGTSEFDLLITPECPHYKHK